jgi:hypothetical protein
MRRLALLPLFFLCGCAAGNSAASIAPPAADTPAPVIADTAYADPAGFSIRYPSGWLAQPNTDLITDTGVLHGTAFVPPNTIGMGTSYLEGYVHASAAEGTCAQGGAAEQAMRIGQHDVSVSTWDSPGAGQLYAGTAYRIEENGACVTVTAYAHTCNLGADCGPGRERPFDPAVMTRAAEAMIGTIRVP